MYVKYKNKCQWDPFETRQVLESHQKNGEIFALSLEIKS